MFGYPFRQPSLREQIEEQEMLVKYLKDKYKEEKKPSKWYESKISLWELAIILAVVSLCAAIPITVWIVNEIIYLKHALDLVIK